MGNTPVRMRRNPTGYAMAQLASCFGKTPLGIPRRSLADSPDELAISLNGRVSEARLGEARRAVGRA